METVCGIKCPFCRRKDSAVPNLGWKYNYYQCCKCGATGPASRTVNGAKAVWERIRLEPARKKVTNDV